MKHSVEELIALSYTLFPRGRTPGDPGYDETPELRRQHAIRVPAVAQYDTWNAMVDRLSARFPPERFPGVHVAHYCFFLQQVTYGAPFDRCFTGHIEIPVRSPAEKRRMLDFFVSFAAPYYTIRSVTHLFTDRRTETGKPISDSAESFTFTPDEEPFIKAIVEEVEATFPGHERMPAEVGLTIVPDVVAGRGWFGEATIFGCLFSDNM